MHEKKLIVAGKIVINATPTMHLNGAPREINDLICYLYCFLDSSVYPGNKPQSTKVIRKILVNAHLSNNILAFSFPKKIRLQFCLQKKYRINISDKNTAFDFFIDDLLPKNKLACNLRFARSSCTRIIISIRTHTQLYVFFSLAFC